jgi:hypothetical protein
VQESADGFFLVEPVLGGEVQDVDAAQFPVGAVTDHRFDGGNDIFIRRLAQGIEQRFRVGHDPTLRHIHPRDSSSEVTTAQMRVRM